MSHDLVTIVRGADRTFYADLCHPDSDTPIDLTDANEITASFPADDGTSVAVSLGDGGVTVLGAPGAGRISIEVDSTHTDDMLVDPSPTTKQDLQVEVETSNGEIIVVVLTGVLSIIDPAYPIV